MWMTINFYTTMTLELECVGRKSPEKVWVKTQSIGATAVIPPSDRGDFWAQPVEIPVFASPAGYMLTSSVFLY